MSPCRSPAGAPGRTPGASGFTRAARRSSWRPSTPPREGGRPRRSRSSMAPWPRKAASSSTSAPCARRFRHFRSRTPDRRHRAGRSASATPTCSRAASTAAATRRPFASRGDPPVRIVNVNVNVDVNVDVDVDVDVVVVVNVVVAVPVDVYGHDYDYGHDYVYGHDY